MELWEINPFIRSMRYAIWHKKNDYYGVSYDTRIFATTCDKVKFILSDSLDIETGNKRELQLNEYSIVVFTAGVPYYFENVNGSSTLRLININFDLTQENRIKSKMLYPCHPKSFKPEMITDKKILNGTRDISKFGFPIVLYDRKDLVSMCMDIWNEYRMERLFYDEKCSAMLKQVLVEIIRADKGNEQQIFKNPNILALAASVLNYIDANYHRPINDSDLQSALNYHPYYLTRIVKKVYGMTPYQYLMKCRINKALYLLTETQISIGEIAEMCGFINASHFSTVIRRMTKKSPSEYRDISVKG